MRVIFNADDYGLHSQVSRGILMAMREGVVRATTVMANLVSASGLAELKELSGVSAGLHANLTKGRPLTQFPCRWLDNEGNFSSKLIFSPDGGATLPYEAVRGEFQAQLYHLLDAGLKLSHIDGHHHIQGFAAALAAVEELAEKHKLAVRPTSAWMAARFARLGLRRPDVLITGFFGKNNLSSGRLMELLCEAASARAETVEVMCHPGLVESLPEGFSSYREERGEELEVLCSPELAAWLQEKGVAVINYAQI